MRLHLVSLPHTQTTGEYVSCAYTQKIVRFGKMMRPLGHEVYIYAGEKNEAECDEHVRVVSKRETEQWFGRHDPDRFYPITWDPHDEHWRTMNRRAAKAISERRLSERDPVLLIAGNCQRQVAEELSDMLSCEWGVGYEGIFTGYCAFESDAWRHHVYGRAGIVDGRWYDAVIPNFFDLDDFYLNDKGDYLLFVGRLVMRKGPHVAAMIAEKLGMRLLVAGQGALHVEPGRIVSEEIVVEGKGVEYVGTVDAEQRAKLMAGARATIVPTLYIEPFGGVAVESMLSGTPAVTTDWGAFTETVEPGVTGERFHTLEEGCRAVERAVTLDPVAVRARAEERFSLQSVGPLYDAWLKRLQGLWGEGWYG